MVTPGLGLAGRTVVVAGAGGGGIGTAVCRLLAEAGVRIAAIDIDEERLSPTLDAITDLEGARCLPLVADVRNEDLVEEVLTKAEAELGHFHGLVHVAGGLRPDQWAPLLSTSGEAIDEVLRLNLLSAVITSRAVARRMVSASQAGGAEPSPKMASGGADGAAVHTGEAGGAEPSPKMTSEGAGVYTSSVGSLVHIASIAGLSSLPFGVGYAMAKAAMLALTRTTAVEWGPYGIRVNAVAPGTVRTPRNRADSSDEDTPAEQAAVPLGRRGKPEDVAGAVLFLLSELATYVTGQVLVVDGGSSVRPSYLDEENMPVFVHDAELRARLRQAADLRR